MVRNVYVVESENTGFYMESKDEAEKWIEKIKSEGQSDIRFTYSEVHIDEDDKDNYSILKDIEVFIP